MTPHLRPMQEEDLDEVLLLWLDLMRTGEQADPRYRLSPHAAERARAHMRAAWLIRRPFPGCLVAVLDDQIIGFVSGTIASPSPVLELPESLSVSDLYVRPSHRRAGIARRLVEAYLELGRRAGLHHFQLATLHVDERAQAFWRALDFHPVMVTLRREDDQGS